MNVQKQPEVNIGLIGHVDHGKTTLTQALSGEWTDRHSEEIKRGISIRLGYADTAFYKCTECDEPSCYTVEKECPECGSECEFLRAISFVDSPGHETLMATMLSGAAIMDGAILIIAANEKCPQPQTREHLMALNVTGVENIVVVQNKIDLVKEKEAMENYQEIRDFLKGSVAQDAPIIPISAHRDTNLDFLIKTIEEFIPTPERNTEADMRMFIARSFDINNPGTKIKDLKGGILGGSLKQGNIEVGEEIEIAPGMRDEENEWQPLTTEITSLFAGGENREKVGPGGLIAIGTSLDPSYTKSDNLAGRLAGKPGTLPKVRNEFTMETHLLDSVVGLGTDVQIPEIKTRDPLLLSVGTSKTVGVVKSARKGIADVVLKIPICADEGQRVAISSRFSGKYHLIGHGIIQ